MCQVENLTDEDRAHLFQYFSEALPQRKPGELCALPIFPNWLGQYVDPGACGAAVCTAETAVAVLGSVDCIPTSVKVLSKPFRQGH